LRVGGRLLAHRLDSGDETSPEIRRIQTFGQVSLAPTSSELSRLQIDLMFAGVELDLTRARARPGGVDATFRCVFGGGNIRVPADWRVAWDRRGIGGVSIGHREPIEKSSNTSAADLRIHLRALFGGVGVRT